MTERVRFQDVRCFRKHVDTLFSLQKAKLKSLLPYADIRHVGSTAIPGSITKGDLDIQVRVSEADFPAAKKILLALYDHNEGTPVTDYFISYKDDSTNPPLGIQLTVKQKEFDIFWKITEVLTENEQWLDAYNELKMRYEDEDMEEYREAKSAFIHQLMATNIFQEKQ